MACGLYLAHDILGWVYGEVGMGKSTLTGQVVGAAEYRLQGLGKLGARGWESAMAPGSLQGS